MSSDCTKRPACAVLLAGGSGTRMRGTVDDKIFAPLAGEAVVAHVIRSFRESGVAGTLVFVCRDAAQEDAVRAELCKLEAREAFAKIVFCRGGKERRDSVLNGLRTAQAAGVAEDAVVLIHDAARPLVSPTALREVYETTLREGAAVLAHRCVNTVKRVPAETRPGTASETEDLDRGRLWETETPQAFPLGKILFAYERVCAENLTVTDDVSAFAVALDGRVALVENLSPNLKITAPADLVLAEAILNLSARTA